MPIRVSYRPRGWKAAPNETECGTIWTNTPIADMARRRSVTLRVHTHWAAPVRIIRSPRLVRLSAFTAGTLALTGVAVVAPSAAVAATAGPAFVQQVSAHAGGGGSLSVTPTAVLGAGDRLVVQVGVWNSAHATTSTVTDAAGDAFTEVSHFAAADGTEQSVWTAPITTGAGTKPAIKATPTSAADIGIAAVEYSGLSTAPGTGYTARVTVAPTADMELLTEDQLVPAGATPNATVNTGANTYWLMTTITFKTG